MANPTYRASTTANNTSGLSKAISSPSSTAIGDVLTVVYSGYSSGTYSPTPVLPSGWTLLKQDIQTGNGYTVHTYTAEFVTTAAGAQQFTFSSSMTASGSFGADLALVCCYNQNSTTPIDDSQVATVPNGTTATSPAATATVANDLILCFYVDNGNTGAVPSLPSGLTSAVSYQDSTNGVGIRVGYASLASSGTTPTYTSTFGETVNPSSGIFGTMFTVLIKAPSSGVSASATQTDGADSQAASGTLTITAQAAQADGADSQAASGTLTITAQATQTDGADSQAASGTLTITAQAAQADGADSQAASGTLTITAQAAQADGTDSQTASGTLTITAQATQTDGADSQAASGTITATITAQAAQADGADSQAASGTLTITAQATQTDGADSQAASGTLTITAQAAQTDGTDSQAASGTITATITAQAAQTDGTDSQAASGTITATIIAQAAQIDGADSQAASGTLTITAQAAQTDGTDSQAASGTLTITAQAAQTDGTDSQAASGTLTITAQAAQTDGTDSQAASGTLTITAQAAQTDGADSQAASGTITATITAQAAQTDGTDSQAASGTLTITAQAAQTDGTDSQAASGTLTIIAQATQIDSGDGQSAGGILGISIVAVQVDNADTQFAFVVPNPPIFVAATQTDGADIQVASLNFNYNTLNEAYLYASQQAATPQFYTMSPPPQANTAVYTQSGTFTVPAYSNYFLVSATAAGGGSPYGAAGRQTSRQSLPVNAGDILTVSISPNVTVQRGAQTLLSLLDGAAYAKGTQGGLPQDSGIVGLGSGVDQGVPFPAALVFIWD